MAKRSDEEKVEQVLAIAVKLKELNPGTVLPGIGHKAIVYYLNIAHGRLDPLLYVRFGFKDYLMRRVATLPIAQQKELAAGKLVELVEENEDGTFSTRMADPLEFSPEQAEQVFGVPPIEDLPDEELRDGVRLE